MIYALIALAEGVVIAALAIICAFVMQSNHDLARERDGALYDVEVVRANMKTLQAKYDGLQAALKNTQSIYSEVLAERNELAARATALQEAMEARPTQPKRAVRKNSTTGEGHNEA